MMEEILLDQELPDSVFINGLIYPVNPGFKTGIRMDLAYHDEKYTLEERYLNMLLLFYPEIPEDIDAALQKMLWFFTRGTYDPNQTRKETEKAAGTGKKESRQFCFSQDATLILSAFYAEYGIMLNRMNDTDLHWWEFMALFEGLPEDTTIKQYIHYRTCDLSGLSDAERKRIRRIRSQIRIRKEIKDKDLSPAMRLQKRDERWLDYARRRSEEVGKT